MLMIKKKKGEHGCQPKERSKRQMKILMVCSEAKGEKMVPMGKSGNVVKIYHAKLSPAKVSPQVFFGELYLESTEPLGLEAMQEYEVIIPTTGIKLVTNMNQ